MAFTEIAKVAILGVLVHGLWKSLQLELPAHLIKATNWQFLTNISLGATVLYQALELVFPNAKFITYFYHLVTNLEFLVTAAYWALTFVFPGSLNKDAFAVDHMLDFQTHFLPYTSLLISRKPKIKFRCSALLSTAFIGAYWGAIELFQYLNQDGVTRYPYPFLNNKSLYERSQWMVVFLLVSFVNYPVQRLLKSHEK